MGEHVACHCAGSLGSGRKRSFCSNCWIRFRRSRSCSWVNHATWQAKKINRPLRDGHVHCDVSRAIQVLKATWTRREKLHADAFLAILCSHPLLSPAFQTTSFPQTIIVSCPQAPSKSPASKNYLLPANTISPCAMSPATRAQIRAARMLDLP